jgi:hypothetical protein
MRATSPLAWLCLTALTKGFLPSTSLLVASLAFLAASCDQDNNDPWKRTTSRCRQTPSRVAAASH